MHLPRTLGAHRPRPGASSLPARPLSSAQLAQSWQVRGGRTVLGTALPIFAGTCAALALAAAVWMPARLAGSGFAPSLLLCLLAAVSGWVAWRLLGTAWQVGRTTENAIECRATGRRWLLRPGEVLGVTGDAYGLFLVLATTNGKIWIWAQIDDRPGVLGAIRRSSPGVEVDGYAGP